MSELILNRVRQVAADILGAKVHQITDESSPKTIAHWDSIQHLNLVLALEQDFNLEFMPEEIDQMQNIRSIASLVEDKLQLAA